MKRLHHKPTIAVLTILLCALGIASADTGKIRQRPAQPSPATVSVFATGLNNPRGLKFGPDGFLYVAEGGIGGMNPACVAVPGAGPYTGSETGSRISRIDANGVRSTFVDDFPSSMTGPAAGSQISGVADIAFIGDTLYALLGGAGCSHGVFSTPNGIVRVNSNATVDLVADLSAFYMANPVANPFPGDFEPDGVPYSMVALRGDLYVVEPNHGELDKVTPAGQITRVTDFSARYGHLVPTAIDYHGNFYVGNLGVFPLVANSKVIKVTPSGVTKVVADGFTAILGIAIDQGNRIYVLENTTGNPFPTPGTGQVTRIDPSGRKTVIATGLFLPTAMTLGPDGALYVSNVGFGPPPIGLGEIVRIALP